MQGSFSQSMLFAYGLHGLFKLAVVGDPPAELSQTAARW